MAKGCFRFPLYNSPDPAIYCPDNGYELPPDPAVFCPANGYTPPEPDGSWEPPIVITNPDTEQIILFCTDNYPSIIYFRVQGNYTVDVMDSEENIIQSTDHASGAYYTYSFPTQDTGAYYILKIKNRSGSTLTLFRCHDILDAGYASNWQILEARFNTPNMVTLTSAFEFIKAIRKVTFISTMNYVTQMGNFFRNSGIEKFVWHSSFNSLLNIGYMFQNSMIRTLDFDGISLPELSTIGYMCNNTSQLLSLNFNPIVPKLSTLSYAFSYSDLQHIFLNCIIGESVASLTIQQIAEYCPRLETFTSFYGHANLESLETTVTSAFRGLPKLKKLIFRGYMKNLNQNAVISTPMLEETDGGIVSYGYNYSLLSSADGSVKKMILPTDKVYGIGPFGIGGSGNPNFVSLEEIVNQPTNGDVPWIVLLNGVARRLQSFDLPDVVVDRLNIGVDGGYLSYVDIDWANSPFGFTGGAVIILYGQLSSSEINRIYTALPTMSKTIDVRYNPGFASADHSIAQAKGWTVTGA